MYLLRLSIAGILRAEEKIEKYPNKHCTDGAASTSIGEQVVSRNGESRSLEAEPGPSTGNNSTSGVYSF